MRLSRFWKAWLAGSAAVVAQEFVKPGVNLDDWSVWVVALATGAVVAFGPKNKEV